MKRDKMNRQDKILNSELGILNCKTEIRNTKSEIRNQKSEISCQLPVARNKKSEIRNKKIENRSKKQETGIILNPGSRIMNFRTSPPAPLQRRGELLRNEKSVKGKIQNSAFRIQNLKASFIYQHKGFIKALILILVVFSPMFAHSQTVDSLIDEGLRNNPLLKSKQYTIDAADRRADAVDALPPPEVGVGFNEIPINSLNIWNESLSNSLSFSQMFHLGGKLKAMTDAERKNVPVAESDLEVSKTDLIGRIKMSYYSLWMLDRKIDVQEDNIKLLEELVRSVDVLYQVNKISQADVLTLKSEIASNQTQLLNLQNQRRAEVFNMNRLLGRDLDSKDIFTEKDAVADSLQYSESELEDMLIKNNPSLKKMANMAEMNEAMITASQKEAYPDLMLEGMLMRMPNGMTLTANTPMGSTMSGTDYGYSIMASVTLPFLPWSSNKYKAKEEELKATNKGIEYERSDMQRQMIAEMKSSLTRLRNASDQMALYKETVIPAYQQALQSQTSAFQTGKAAINALIDQNRMLIMQEMNYFMAQADYQMALAEIEMMTGKRLGKESTSK